MITLMLLMLILAIITIILFVMGGITAALIWVVFGDAIVGVYIIYRCIKGRK